MALVICDSRVAFATDKWLPLEDIEEARYLKFFFRLLESQFEANYTNYTSKKFSEEEYIKFLYLKTIRETEGNVLKNRR